MNDLLTATGNDWNAASQDERSKIVSEIIITMNHSPGVVRTINPTELCDEVNAFYQTKDADKLGRSVLQTMAEIIRDKKMGQQKALEDTDILRVLKKKAHPFGLI